MDLIIVTNNRMIAEEFGGDDSFELIVEEELPDLLEKCMELVGQGCQLAVDPLAGYLSRYNPYHTIVLKRKTPYGEGSSYGVLSENDGGAQLPDKEAYLRDMSKLDVLLSRYWLNRDAYASNGQTAERRSDHAHVDASIGRNSILRIKELG